MFVLFFFSLSQFMLSPLSFLSHPYLVSVTNTTPRMKDDLLLHLQTAPNTPWHCSSFTYIIVFESSLPQDEFLLMNWVLVCAVSYYQQSHLHGVVEFGSTYYPRKRAVGYFVYSVVSFSCTLVCISGKKNITQKKLTLLFPNVFFSDLLITLENAIGYFAVLQLHICSHI